MSGDTWGLLKRYDNSQETPSVFNKKSTVQGLLVAFSIISWACVTLRLHTRYRLQCLGWDDLFVLIFRISGTIGTSFILILFNHGFGQHFWALSVATQEAFQQGYYVCLITYTVSTALMKLCLLTQYLRLFGDNAQARRTCWIFLAISGTWGIAFSVIAIVPCVPVSGFWDWQHPARCYGFGSHVPDEIGGTYAAHVGTNVLLDLAVLAIPIPFYLQTFKEKKQRIGFGIMIVLGSFINLVSIWRLVLIIKTRAATYPVGDPTFYGPQSIVLAALEVDLASIVASIPVFWPLITNSWGAIFVTQEVHVTHHHRRLSGDDPFELRTTARRSRSESTGDESLKLVIMGTDDESQHRKSSEIIRQITRGRSNPSPTPSLPPAAMQRQKSYDQNDPYFRSQVYPHMEGGIAASEALVVSEGQRGFERSYREHFGVAPPGASHHHHHNRHGENSAERQPRGSKDEHQRSWSISLSRKSSVQRF